jgi:hypothetical protein
MPHLVARTDGPTLAVIGGRPSRILTAVGGPRAVIRCRSIHEYDDRVKPVRAANSEVSGIPLTPIGEEIGILRYRGARRLQNSRGNPLRSIRPLMGPGQP